MPELAPELPDTHIGFRSVDDVTLIDRHIVAQSLSRAASANEGLKTELPIPAESYSDFYHAYQRLRFIRRKVARNMLQAYVVYDDQDIIGMATVENGAPGFGRYYNNERCRELSYWHADYERPAIAAKVGVSILEKLVNRAEEPDKTLWMVTLPDDKEKQESLLASGFERRYPPRSYDIRDRVTKPRQLWVHLPPAAPLTLRQMPKSRA